MNFEPAGSGRLVIALLLLGVLAGAAWFTMEPGKPRYLTMVLLGFFTFRVVLTKVRSRYDG